MLCYISPQASRSVGIVGAENAEQAVRSASQDRTEAVAHYIIARSQPDKLGAVKLNKVMWFADLESYRRCGHTITGQLSYQKQARGPVPNNIVRALNRLRDDDKIFTREVPVAGFMRREHLWLAQPDVSVFTPEEVDILNEAIDWVCNDHTARSISELSHDALWEEAELGEQIPIGAAAVAPDDLCGDDMQWALAGLATAE